MGTTRSLLLLNNVQRLALTHSFTSDAKEAMHGHTEIGKACVGGRGRGAGLNPCSPPFKPHHPSPVSPAVTSDPGCCTHAVCMVMERVMHHRGQSEKMSRQGKGNSISISPLRSRLINPLHGVHE